MTTILTGGLLGVGVIGTLSAVTSYKACKVTGVYADGKTITIKSRPDESEETLVIYDA